MNKIIWELPLKTVSEANCHEHWRIKSRRHKQQQFFIRQLFNSLKTQLELPCCVKMIRLGPKYLDDDNLVSAFKYVRDEISECLIPAMRKVFVNSRGKVQEIKGRADADPRIKWEYAQEKAKILAIRIEIT